MVDSAVTLSIGTELDLSGLEKDLAALKDYDFNLKIGIDTEKFQKQLRQLENDLDCIKVALCVDDSKLQDVLSKVYKLQVEIDVTNAEIKGGRINLDTDQIDLQIDRLDKSITTGFNDLLDFLKESQRAAGAKESVQQATKPITDVVTGIFEGFGRDIKQGVSKGIESRTGFNVEKELGRRIGGDKFSGQKTTKLGSDIDWADIKDIARSASRILTEVQGLGNLANLPNSVTAIVEEVDRLVSKTKETPSPTPTPPTKKEAWMTGGALTVQPPSELAKPQSGLLAKMQGGALAKMGGLQDLIAVQIEAYIVDQINSALSLVPGKKGVIDVSKRISSLSEVTPALMGDLAKKGLLQSAIGVTSATRGTYGALKGAENAVLSLDPTGVAKLVKNIATPLLLTAAATQVPGAGAAVGGAVNVAQSALAPLGDVAATQIISTLSGAIADVVGGLPLIGGQLEAGLISTITTAVTEAVTASSGLAAAGIVGKGLEAGAGAIASRIAPESKALSEKTMLMSEGLATKLIADLNGLRDEIKSLKLPRTLSLLPGATPSVTPKALPGFLQENLNVKGLKDVYKQLTGTSGESMNRPALTAAIVTEFEKDQKKTRDALAKVSKGGLKKGTEISTFGKPALRGKEYEEYYKEIQKIRRVSVDFASLFDQSSKDVQIKTKQGLEELLKVLTQQLESIETVTKDYQLSSKSRRQLSYYKPELEKQKQQLMSRYESIGGNPNIEKAWKRTTDYVQAEITDLTKFSQEKGYSIQKALSEGSPGITVEIRKHWTKTAAFLEDKIEALTKSSQQKGKMILKAMATEPPEFVEKLYDEYVVLQHQISRVIIEQSKLNELLKEIESVEQSPTINQKSRLFSIKQRIESAKQSAKTTYAQEASSQAFQRGKPPINVRATIEKAAKDLALGFDSIIKRLDERAGGRDINRQYEEQRARVTASTRLSEEAKARTLTAMNRNEQRKVQERLALTSNISTLAGSTAFSLAPLETLQALATPFTLALAPLIAGFNAASATITNFVSRISTVLQELTPLQIRFASIAQQQNRKLDQEIVAREDLVRELERTGGSEAEIKRQQVIISGLKGRQQTPEDIMGVPKQLAQEYSIPMMSTMQSFSKFVAAASGTALEGKGVEELFKGITQSVSALGLSAQDAELVFLAFQQMMSKGKITAEELRQQLAERMPGAVQLFAESLGMTQSEFGQAMESGTLDYADTLMKVADEMQSRYGDAAKAAGNSIIGASNRIQNSLQQAQLAIAEQIAPAFSFAINTLSKGLDFFAQRAEGIFNFVANLFFDLVMTMTVSWAALWDQIGGFAMKAIAPLMAAMYKYMAPFAINIGVDFIDNFYKALTGKDVMSPLQVIMKGIENAVWTAFTAIKSLGDGIVSVFQSASQVLVSTFGSVFSVVGKLADKITSLGVPLVELATTFVFVNQTMAFFGVNAQFIAAASRNLKMFFAEVVTGAGRMRLLQGAVNGVALGLSSLELKMAGVFSLLLLMFAKSDFKDPLKIELDKTLETLESVTQQAKEYGKTVEGIAEQSATVSKGFNVTFGISEALGGQKIMTDDIIRALRGDLGEEMNKAAFTFLATLTSGLGIALLPVKTIVMTSFQSIGAILAKSFAALTPVISSLATVMGTVFSSVIGGLSPIFAKLGMVAGVSIPKGMIAGIAILGTTIAATIADVFTGGAVREALTDAAKRFGLIAIAEMQERQRREKRTEAVTAALDAVKQTFFVEFQPGQIQGEIDRLQKELESKPFLAFGEKGAIKRQINELKIQQEGEKQFGKAFTSRLREDTQIALDEVKKLDQSILQIQQRMNDVGRMTTQAEISGNTEQLAKYNQEYEQLNKELQGEISARQQLVAPYQEMLTLLQNAKQALVDELRALEQSGQFNPAEAEALNLQISRVEATIQSLKDNGVTNLELLQDQFDATAKRIENNNYKLGELVKEINRLKAIELTNIAEAFASGDITQAQKDIRIAKTEIAALRRELDVTGATYQANLKELEILMQRPSQTLSEDERSRRSELINSVKEQELKVYELRTSLADATVQAREAAESAMTDFISKSAERNSQAVMSEAQALQVLQAEIQKTLMFAKMLESESGIEFNIQTSGLEGYVSYLEKIAGLASQLNVDLSGYVQEVGGFATEQAEIDRLLKSKKPEDREVGRRRQEAMTGRQAILLREAKSDIETAAIERDLRLRLQDLQATSGDVFQAEVSVTEAFIAKNNALINNRKQQIVDLIRLEQSGVISRSQQLQKTKQLQDEIQAAEEDTLSRQSALLDARLALVDREKEAAMQRIEAIATESTLKGGDPLAVEKKRQSDLQKIVKESVDSRVDLLKEASAQNLADLQAGVIAYDEFITKEKDLTIRREEEQKKGYEAIAQARQDGFAQIDAVREKEIAKIEEETAISILAGTSNYKAQESSRQKIQQLNQQSLADKKAYIEAQKVANRDDLANKRITYDQFLTVEKELANASIEIQKESTQSINDLIQQRSEALGQLRELQNAVFEAQIKGQERATLAANIYADALSKQGELIQAQSRVKGFSSNEKILAAELEISRLNKQSEGMSEEEKAGIQAKIQEQSLKIAQEKAKLLEQEQETQRKLLALEIERNKIAAQQQIKEAEIAALRARNAVVAAQIAVKEKAATGNQDEIIQAQLGLELATEEFQFALAQIDISKQNAVINDQLSALERQGLLGEQNLERQRQAGEFRLQFDSASNPFNFGGGKIGFSLDPSVQALANMGAGLASVTDFSKYDALLSQLDRAAQPLEAQLETQTNAIKATNDLTGAITSLNEKITGLVTTLGRPNISVSGGSSIADVYDLMRMTK